MFVSLFNQPGWDAVLSLEGEWMMKTGGPLVFGLGLILLGTILLIGILTNIDVWTFFWPAFLIGLGFWLIFKPALTNRQSAMLFRPLVDIKRYGEWVVEDREIWIFVGM